MEDETTEKLPPVPGLPEDVKKEIALGMIQNRYFFVQDIPDEDMHLLGQIFMVVGLAGLDYDPKTVGTIYAPLSAAGSLAINGYPMFFEHRLINKEDWIDIIEDFDRRAKAAGLR